MMKQRPFLLCLAALFTLTVFNLHSAEKGKHKVDLSKIPAAADKKGVTYASDIKTIFDNSCVKCHGPEKPKGKLRLDSMEGILKGGEDGKVVKPGDGPQSMLLQNIAHAGDPDDFMPPPKNKANIGPLSAEQIALIRAWIDQGAK
jgi:mono/diheme cytochrome c family protein